MVMVLVHKNKSAVGTSRRGRQAQFFCM